MSRRRFFDDAIGAAKKGAGLSTALWIFCSGANVAEAARYLVKMRAGSSLNPQSRQSIRAANTRALSVEMSRALSIGSKSRSLEDLGIVVVEGQPGEIQNMLKSHPLVDYYESEREWKIASYEDQPYPSSQNFAPWMKDLLGLNADSPNPDVIYSGEKPVVVAVIDTGTNITHPFLRSALSTNASELNGVSGEDDDGNGYVDDLHGASVFSEDGDVSETQTNHGTHVAGIIKSIRDQAIVTHPEAAAVQILPVRFINNDGVGSTSGAIEALEYAVARGSSVVNASWGARGEEAYSRALFDAFVELYNKDIVITVAAGNAERGVANNNDATPYFPANFRIPGLISIASVTPVYGPERTYRDVFLSSFSNYGVNTVDVAAPGDYMDEAGGTGIWSSYSRFATSASAYIRKKGTSMATPVVSGIAGVVRALNPSLTNYEVKQLILAQATQTPKLSKVRSSAMVTAENTFAAAQTAETHGLRPEVGDPGYGEGSSSESSAAEKRKGACGTVRDIASNEGPMGGNSLLLLAGLYFLVRQLRSIFRRSPVL